MKASGKRRETLSWDDVGKGVLERLRIDVERVNWFSTYHVHHRVADRFRHGRAFLLGDAAHIHSPVGGQGMNTGISDAVNLAWKLAAVLQGRALPSLLDTYEPERIAFARATGGDDGPGLHGSDKPRPRRAADPRRSRTAIASGPGPFGVRSAPHVPHGLANGDALPRQPLERGAGGSSARRRSPAVDRSQRFIERGG